MELPTYTSIFTLRRKLYAIYDWELPRPVEMVQVGVFAIGVLIVWGITHAFGVGLSAASAWVFVVPPAALAWYSTQPIADGKGLGLWLAAQARYLCEPKVLTTPAHDSSPLTGWVEPPALGDTASSQFGLPEADPALQG